jgi:hypothetical protein
MPSTYEKIDTTTLGTASNSVTFSSIPATYTDLVIIVAGATSTISGVNLQFNSDTGSNYSRTALFGTGSTAGSVRSSNVVQIGTGTLSTTQGVSRINVMNYSNSTTNKTTISRTDLASDELSTIVGLWRNTAAINTIKVAADFGVNFNTGTTFTLYGIRSA